MTASTAPPKTLAVNVAGIPKELTVYSQWVAWTWEQREGKWTKPPINVRTGTHADSTNPETWSRFDEAVAVASRYAGIGIVVTAEDPIVGVDLDKCRDPATGTIAPWAQKIIDRFQTYTEVSPSGRGVHLFLHGRLPGGRGRKREAVEVYDRARFWTITGCQVDGTPLAIEDRQDALDELLAEWFPVAPSASTNGPRPPGASALDDERVLTLARQARNGEQFASLYESGNWESAGFPSQSEADLWLCGRLAFWTGRDAAQIDRLFRASSLMRAKWDERHGAQTYGAMTIERAIATTHDVYQDRSRAGGHDDVSVVVLDSGTWPPPEPVPTELPPVPDLDVDRLLPAALAPWVRDVADRAQCPPDFVAVGVLVATASVVGRQIAIRPKGFDDWTVVPNLWGLAVGRPGLMKTAAMQEALRGMHGLIAQARESHAGAMKAYEFNLASAKARRKAVEKQLEAAAANGEPTETLRADFEAARLPEPPIERRYLVNDTTVEKLGALLNLHPNGLLVFRDEISGFLRTMDREGHENDRAFYCESWNGTGSYTYDRIGRGTLHIEAACVSILGGIQPMPLAAYLREAFAHGQNDGLIQRFQLMVYPDVSPQWRNVDRWPDTDARRRVVDLFRALDRMDVDALAAHRDDGGRPFLHFTPEAQALFDAWRAHLEERLRAGDEHPVIETHIAKYRSLLPSLALLFHIIDSVDRGIGGPVSATATERAIGWCNHLELHARRVYEDVIAPERLAAAALAKKLTARALPSPFTARDVRRKQWAGLGTPEAVSAALGRLEDLHWVRPETVRSQDGGRPTVRYHVNPLVAGGRRR